MCEQCKEGGLSEYCLDTPYLDHADHYQPCHQHPQETVSVTMPFQRSEDFKAGLLRAQEIIINRMDSGSLNLQQDLRNSVLLNAAEEIRKEARK